MNKEDWLDILAMTGGLLIGVSISLIIFVLAIGIRHMISNIKDTKRRKRYANNNKIL